MLVITSCSASKATDHPDRLTLADFRDARDRGRKEASLKHLARPAGLMYTGYQHLYLMEGVATIRRVLGKEAVRVMIISAGYGLIPEDKMICPYEATFTGMSRREALIWASELEIAEDTRVVAQSDKLCIFLLGGHYLSAVDSPIRPLNDQRLIFLTKPANASKLRAPGITVVPAGKEQTNLGAGLAALKGKMFQRFAVTLAEEHDALLAALMDDDTPSTFLDAVSRGRA